MRLIVIKLNQIKILLFEANQLFNSFLFLIIFLERTSPSQMTPYP
ncbi:hypothetical protein ECDEC12E_5464 [Escherichia coli DEC12E]|nr:hypothetical protein ECDEC12E_5464 [Escherichia coli DEC12E]